MLAELGCGAGQNVFPARDDNELVSLRIDGESVMHDPEIGKIRMETAGEFDPQEIMPVGAELGSYKILDVLGTGGMGIVYLAEHSFLGRQVAIKKLHTKFTANEDMVARFFREGRMVNAIKHEGITQITDFVVDGGAAYYVMELLEGQTLSALQASEGALPVIRALPIAMQLCDVLAAVHEAGIVHRDLKPDNVFLINRQMNRDTVKLLDFGVARADAAGLDDQTAAGIIVGTPFYMSPEQAEGKSIDHRCDIYAVGIVLFQMVTGQRPFVADSAIRVMVMHATEPPPSPAELSPWHLPPELEDLILRCLAKDPADRPQTAKQLFAELRKINRWLLHPNERPASTPPPTGTLPPATKRSPGLAKERLGAEPKNVRRRIAVGVSTATVVALGLFSLFLWRHIDAPSNRDTTAEAVVQRSAPEPDEAATQPTPPREPDAPSDSLDVVDVGTDDAVAAAAPAPKPDARSTKAHRKKRPHKGTRPPKGARSSTRSAKSDPPSAVTPPPKPASPTGLPQEAPKAIAKPTPTQPEISPAEQHFNEARGLLRLKKTLLAIQELNKCIAADPKLAKAHKALGKAYMQLHREDKAVKAFERYVEMAPGAPDVAALKAAIDDYHRRQSR